MSYSHQKPETVEFWNSFYRRQQQEANLSLTTGNEEEEEDDLGKPDGEISNKSNGANNKEWIVHPTRALLDKLFRSSLEKQQEHGHPLRILEIGCGTSTLSREVYLYFHTNEGTIVEDQMNHRRVHVVATDVSAVCIDQMNERDATWLSTRLDSENATQDDGNSRVDGVEHLTGLEYCVVDLTNSRSAPEWFENYFDYILDKGCLDTFVFRSRNRGSSSRGLVECVLDNLWSWLNPCTGRYLILTPRSRVLPQVRSFSGLKVLPRHVLDTSQFAPADLDGTRARNSTPASHCSSPTAAVTNQRSITDGDNTCMDSNDLNNINSEQQKPTQNHSPPTTENSAPKTFLYECIKTSKERDNGDASPGSSGISNDTSCPNCSITFEKFCKGEPLEGRGHLFWYRKWRGHLQHCSTT